MSIYLEVLKSLPHNSRELLRYVKFIEDCIKKNKESTDKLVAHHICPEAGDMFPQYGSLKNYPWNKALLTDRQHYIAHMMLWKIYRNRSMTFAFNMMSNFEQIHYSSRLYEKHREDFRKFISELNSRPRTDSEKKILSEKMKNTISVYDIRDKDKRFFRISKNDPEYDPTYHIFYRIGYKHSEETKAKIGRPGKKSCYHPVTKHHTYVMDNNLPEGCEWGTPPGIYTGDHIKDTVWCYDPITKEHIRVKEEQIPDNYVKGKFMISNPGIDKANSMLNIVDLENRKATKVFHIDKKIHGPESGASTAKTIVYLFDNKIFTNWIKLIDFARNKGYYFEKKSKAKASDIEQTVVKQAHFNCKKGVKEFRMKYVNKTYRELGLTAIELKDFDLEYHKDKEIYW